MVTTMATNPDQERLTRWKIELTWHDGRRDRKYRDVVQAVTFEGARTQATMDAMGLGLFDAGVVFCTEARMFNELEQQAVEAATRRFLVKGFGE